MLPLKAILQGCDEMFDDFRTVKIDAGETTIFMRSFGSGPPILLLHGFPQSRHTWRHQVPALVVLTIAQTGLGYATRNGENFIDTVSLHIPETTVDGTLNSTCSLRRAGSVPGTIPTTFTLG